MTEEWSDIPGYEGHYMISSVGRIKSLERQDRLGRTWPERILKQGRDLDGYAIIGLSNAEFAKPRRTFRVSRLVASAFVPNPNNYPEVNHIDEDKTNNRAENLEWCTTKYNLTYGHRLDCARGERNKAHKLTREDVIEIRRIYVKGDLQFGQSALAKKYGVKHPSIAAIVNGKSWKHIKGDDTYDT